MDAADRVISAVDELHSSPVVACQILQVLKDPDYDVAQIERLLEADPALAAAVLRLVNSSCFGLSQRIASLRQAVAYLGARTLRLVVLSFGLVGRLTRGAPARVCADFWRRALTTAAGASLLCQRSDGPRPDEAYAAGLLAEVGVLLLAQAETQRYAPLYEEHPHGAELLAAEETSFHVNHAVLGERLLEQWSLPELIAGAVGKHHDDPPDKEPLAQLVAAGNMLADALWTPQTPRMETIRQFLLEAYGVDMDGLIGLAVDCKREIEQYADVFRVRLDAAIDCEAIRQAAQRQFKVEAIQNTMDLDSLTAVMEPEWDNRR